MKKLTVLIVLGALCLYFPVRAQEKAPASYLMAGDTLPELPVSGLLNTRMKPTTTAAFKGKLLLLDFWSTWCSACIDGFGHLNKLQRSYPDLLQVLLVNPKKCKDKLRGVQDVIDRTKAWEPKGFDLPILLQDTAISARFDIRSLPYCVWVSREGKILAITGKEAVTDLNIARAIAGKPLEITTAHTLKKP